MIQRIGCVICLCSLFLVLISCASNKGLSDKELEENFLKKFDVAKEFKSEKNSSLDTVESLLKIKKTFASAREFYEIASLSLDNEDWLDVQEQLDKAVVLLYSVNLSKDENKDLWKEKEDLSNQIMLLYENTYPGVADLAMMDSSQFYYFETLKLVNTDSKVSFLDSINVDDFSLPVVLNERVLAEIKYFSKYAPSFFQKSLIRKTALDSMIFSKIKERNMPEDLVYLALVESGYKFKAYSRAKASGIWQFIPATGRRYGLKTDYWIDMRRNPELATEAALSYLSDLHKMFDDWLLAMAAYNCGEGRVRRLLKKSETRSYWDLKLPKETMHYVPRILAAAVLGHHPDKFGFNVDSVMTWEQNFDTVSVNHCISLKLIADSLNLELDTLKILNYELLRLSTPPKFKDYKLKLPVGYGEKFREIYATMDTIKFTDWQRHKVNWGENLSVIADKYGVKVRDIKEANNMRSTRLKTGQYLVIPVPSGGVSFSEKKSSSKSKKPEFVLKMPPKGTSFKIYTVQKGDNLFDISRKFKVSIEELKLWNDMKNARLDIGNKLKIYDWDSYDTSKIVKIEKTSEIKAEKNNNKIINTPKGKKIVYKVESGDNLSYIAQKFSVDVQDIKDWNSFSSNGIYIGQKLVLYNVTITDENDSDSSKVKENSGEVWYLVKKGDTLWDISRKYEVSVSQLQELNNLDSGLKPGIKIRIK